MVPNLQVIHRNLTISSTEGYILVANIDSAWIVYCD